MLTRLMVIQKIHTNGTVEVFQADSNIFHWAFESRRTRLSADHDYFPFYIGGTQPVNRQAGAETSLLVKPGEIIFSKDYAMPAGTVVGILFPPLYIPAKMTFQQKAFIPVGDAPAAPLKPPGQIEIVHNELERRCAIIFHIHKNSCFGFDCISNKVSAQQDFVKTVQLFKSDLGKEKMLPEVWLQSHEVTRLLKINDRTLMRRRKDGTIPFSGTRGNYLYKKSDIEALLGR